MSDSDAQTASPELPAWVRPILMAAAFYNLAWGTGIVLFPNTPFLWLGMEPPNYPALVQCLGMVVGVYGVGYALAARDPVALWPLVLVGLLGKVLGPIGFVYAALQGEFPWVAGVGIVTNDLIWWLPFTAILFHAWRIADTRRAVDAGVSLPRVLAEARTQRGVTLAELSRQQPVLVVCVRHLGCTYCREAISDVAVHRASIEAAGARQVIVHMGTFAQGDALLKQFGCDGVDQVSDPERRVYQALQLQLGTLSELFGLKPVWRAVLGGTLLRYGLGSIVGNALQLAGVFLIRDSQIVRAYRHRSSADKPDLRELVCPL